MKYSKYIKLTAALAIGFGFVACEPEFENEVKDGVQYTNGDADFSKFVAVGNSLTAGFADGALYIEGQNNSLPNILAGQFATVGGGDFTQPLMADNLGGLVAGGTQVAENRFVLRLNPDGSPMGPVRLAGMPATDITNVLSGPFSNMGVPGAKSFHLGFQGYAGLNPYFGRMASDAGATIVGDAAAQNPSFFMLWIGNNDALSYATSGGVGVDQTGNLNPATYGQNDLTDPNVFAASYNGTLQALTAGGAKGVVANLPDVTSIPFFTTVPNNALVLDAQQAAGLTGFFQAYAGIVTQGLIANGVPPATAQALASQYAFTFTPGPNRFLIKVPASNTNPQGIKQMSENELLLFTIDRAALATQGYGSVALTPEVLQVLGILQGGGTPTPAQAGMVVAAVNPINDQDALDTEELTAISTAQAAYNATIQALATQNGLAFVDMKSILAQAANGGVAFDEGVVTSTYASGGGFSLDGVHPTARGYALSANAFIDAINATYNSRIPKVNIGDYPTIYVE